MKFAGLKTNLTLFLCLLFISANGLSQNTDSAGDRPNTVIFLADGIAIGATTLKHPFREVDTPILEVPAML